MRLESLTAKNYRTLQDLFLTFSPYYCTLSGQNNAGKSCVIQLLVHLFEPTRGPWQFHDYGLTYRDDCTKWTKSSDPILVQWNMVLSHEDDPSLIAYIDTITSEKLSLQSSQNNVELIVEMTIDSNSTQTTVIVDSNHLPDRLSGEVVAKLKRSQCVFLHNSAEQNNIMFAGPGRRKTIHEVYLSEEEQKALARAAKTVERKTRQLAKGHRDDLSNLLGKLKDKYEVEFTTLEGFRSPEMMLGINLKDNKVEVPIDDWGSGTRNRTNILMSLLHAKRMKDQMGSDDKLTPIVVVEEPESFLHPAAQSEFGGVLQDLSQELGIQIIVSTHSPFMLNRVSSGSNILLRRKVRRGQLQETEIVDTSGQNWMEPFSEHLGIVRPEFDYWSSLFSSRDSRVLLVEGKIDKEYFELIRKMLRERSGIPDDVEIIEYGGKDALKNTVLVNFVLKNFSKVFVTFDVDAADEVRKSLERLGMEEGSDYLAVGRTDPGKQAIEGLLPERVSGKVFGREPGLVMQLGSTTSRDRSRAKSQLKKFLLDEFKNGSPYTDSELKGFLEIGKVLREAFGKR